MSKNAEKPTETKPQPAAKTAEPVKEIGGGVIEIGGAKGPEPTRFGDWEHKGRCTDF